MRAPSPERSRVPFLLLCLSILGGAMLGALALNTAMATTAYEIRDKQAELAELTEQQEALTAQFDGMSSPSELADAAAAIGMVPAEGLSYIDLADGTITGPAVDGDAG